MVFQKSGVKVSLTVSYKIFFYINIKIDIYCDFSRKHIGPNVLMNNSFSQKISFGQKKRVFSNVKKLIVVFRNRETLCINILKLFCILLLLIAKSILSLRMYQSLTTKRLIVRNLSQLKE